MLLDALQRPLGNLRLSVTDRCNLRCQYCMPEREYVWLPREDILHFEEIERVVDAFLDLGVTRVRLTGGEPLLRQDLPALVARLASRPRVEDLAMTTNGVLLAPLVHRLKDAGLQRLTVSLDTLQPDRFTALTRSRELDRVLDGIDAAVPLFPGLKLDTVMLRGVNDEELLPLVDFARDRGAEIRFIEYMDVGGATHWSRGQVVTRAEILERLSTSYGAVESLGGRGPAPADRFRLPNGQVVGIIASTTAPFCRDCDRSRLTADGMWYLCLYAARGTDLRGLLRGGISHDGLVEHLRAVWQRRSDRGAEQRLALGHRAPMIPAHTLKRDPHLEMHTRGG